MLIVLLLRACIHVEFHTKSKTRSRLALDDIFIFIKHHLYEEISLERLEKEFFISKYHISREFKRQTGITVHQYIVKAKLDLCKRLLGFPNVGKSTFINRIAGAARAQVGDRPGVTRSKQWVKVSDYLELLDTPGLLWGKLDNEILAKHLAYIGSIRDDVLDIEEISALLLFDLMRICPEALTARYKKLDPEQNIPELLLEGVCRSRGFILSGGVFDTERGARIVLDEYRAGKIAAVALENPTDNFEPQQAEQTDINNEKD